MTEKPVGYDAVWRMIGLAARAGQVQTGTEAALQAIRRQKACLVLIADDMAEDSANRIAAAARLAGTPVRRCGSKGDLGHWTGHDERAVAVIRDSGFAGRIIELIDTRASTGGVDRQQDDSIMFGG